MLQHSAQSGRHSLAARGLGLYQTPPQAIAALLTVERLPFRLWDPCAGNGGIVQPLRAAGFDVIARDIIERDFELNSPSDFLASAQAPTGVEAIIANPPYRFAEKFVAHALELAPTVITLLRLAFLESVRRTPILDAGKLARIHVFKSRCP